MEIQDIKNCLPLLQVLAHYNIQPDRHNQILCPFHADDKPSCKIYPETNTYHCFGCNKSGDVIQFIQDKEGCSKHLAILKAESWITGLPEPSPSPQPKPTKQPTTEPNYPELFTYFLQSIERSANAQSYCQQRGLDYKNLEIGYNSAEKWNKLKQCLIVPLKDKNGNITSLYGRRIAESPATLAGKKGHALEYGKHYYSENRSGLYPNYPPQETQTLIITEAIIDAATLALMKELKNEGNEGIKNVSILAAYGTNGFTKEHKAAVKALPNLKEIIIFFDGDEPGEESAALLAESLHELLPQVNICTIETLKDEDINSIYLKYGAETILQLINKRTILFPSFELSLTEPSNLQTFQLSNYQTISNPQTYQRPNLQTI